MAHRIISQVQAAVATRRGLIRRPEADGKLRLRVQGAAEKGTGNGAGGNPVGGRVIHPADDGIGVEVGEGGPVGPVGVQREPVIAGGQVVLRLVRELRVRLRVEPIIEQVFRCNQLNPYRGFPMLPTQNITSLGSGARG